MTTIYLIRHAEAEGNRYRRAHGWYNSTITDRGYRQIAALSKRFADTKFDAVYSSDRFRTMITALSIYKTHGLPLRTVRALREIDVGYWEDTPWAELERIDPEQLANFSSDSQSWHVPGCESFAEVRDFIVLKDITGKLQITVEKALPRCASGCARRSRTSPRRTRTARSPSSPTAWRCASSSARFRA